MRAGAIALAIAACTVARTPGYAQTLSFAPTTESAIAGARGAVALDLNRDGWLDIATANTGTNAVAILLNRGAAGGFLAPRSITVGADPFDIASGDLDRDGIPDLVVTTTGAPAITVLFLRTDATVRSRRTISSAESRGVAVADWTRDGALDVIYSDFVGRRVGVIPGTGSGTFAAPFVWSLTSRPQGIVAHDFNHDGFLDIAVANASGTSLTVLNGSAAPP